MYEFETPIDDFCAEFSYFNAPESKALKEAIERLYGDFSSLKVKYAVAHLELIQIHHIGLCIAECLPVKQTDSSTVRMVKEMADRLNKLTPTMRGEDELLSAKDDAQRDGEKVPYKVEHQGNCYVLAPPCCQCELRHGCIPHPNREGTRTPPSSTGSPKGQG